MREKERNCKLQKKNVDGLTKRVEKLNEEDIEKLCGGRLSDEALTWYNNNLNAILQKASKNEISKFAVLSIIRHSTMSYSECSLEKLKKCLSRYIDISDLE